MEITHQEQPESTMARYVTLMGVVVKETEQKLQTLKKLRVAGVLCIVLQIGLLVANNQPGWLVITSAAIVLYLAYAVLFGYYKTRERTFLNAAGEHPVTQQFFLDCAAAFGVSQDAAMRLLNQSGAASSAGKLTFADVVLLRYMTVEAHAK